MLQIDNNLNRTTPSYGLPVLRLGFRPFFLAAGLFAIFSMLVWALIYQFSLPVSFDFFSAITWHAHEMIFGYAVAVIAGFLLTAIKNWTGQEVISGYPLALLFLLWLMARILPFTNLNLSLWVIALIDTSFLLILALVCVRPILRVKQYKQVGIIAKLLLMAFCHVIFYLGVAGILEQGVQWGLYSAIYMIVALVLVMMRRVMPMFIKNGVDGSINITNRKWLDYSSLLLLLALWIFDVFTPFREITAILAFLLVILHVVRLVGWYSHKVWSKPLVWILIVSYLGLIVGFGLTTLSVIANINPFLAIHAYTVGGIGLVTIGMMSRVTLGHTGRDVFTPPSIVFFSFGFLVLAFIVRVFFPLFLMNLYSSWLLISQMLWIMAFILFVWGYAPMLVRARVDGRDG